MARKNSLTVDRSIPIMSERTITFRLQECLTVMTIRWADFAIHDDNVVMAQIAAFSRHVIKVYGVKMNRFTAYCGLDCESCEARIATVNDDDALRRKVAALWSELNGVEITADMIHCAGCRIDGVKTPYCDSLCPIRACAREKQVETCGACPEMRTCEALGAITGNNPDALCRLESER